MITDFTLPHGGCETLAWYLAHSGRLVDYLAVSEGVKSQPSCALVAAAHILASSIQRVVPIAAI